jgi:hypothetical protein
MKARGEQERKNSFLRASKINKISQKIFMRMPALGLDVSRSIAEKAIDCNNIELARQFGISEEELNAE